MPIIPKIIIITFVTLSLLWLALVIRRQTSQKRQILQDLNAADDDTVEAVFKAVESFGDASSTTCILARMHFKANDSTHAITIPASFTHLPWAGQTVHITLSPALQMHLSAGMDNRYQLNGKQFRRVNIPSIQSGMGGGDPLFSPHNWLANNSGLLSALRRISARYPEKLLVYLICPGKTTIDYEPTEQVRIGGGVSWVQGVATPTCSQCDELMAFILQLPGSLLDPTTHSGSVAYLFGCRKHPQQTKSFLQYH